MPLVPKLLRPSVLLRRNAMYKGVLGGSKGWLAIGGVLWGKSFLKKTFGKNEEILGTEKLTKGQYLRLDAVKPPTRRQQRKAKRQAKADAERAKAAAKRAAADAAIAKAAAKRARADAKRAARRSDDTSRAGVDA
ncbi:MAG: hypothetical protein KDB40_17440 [Acidimicrobiales bacterium]|nr:hypothetical protein [Acidimicrobiales bacterium]MCB9394545.1 hypothetical protein [Acidimicrobiaceae bacterium]